MDYRQAPLHVLMVEDSQADAELILRAMRELGMPVEHRRVSSEAALREALRVRMPEIILSDFAMPGFSGQDALRIAHELAPDVPFLFVSGTIGEELAIEALQRGADDYVLKDNLRRLPSSMRRALRAARERSDREGMAAALQESEERFRSIVESSQDWIWEIDAQGRIVYTNDAVRDMLGYAPQDLLGLGMRDLMTADSRAAVEALVPQFRKDAGRWQRLTIKFRHRNGAERTMISNARPILDVQGTVTGFRGTHHDDTERRAQETRIRQLVRIHEVLSAFGTQVLRASDRKQVLDRACEVAVQEGGFRAALIATMGQDHALHFVARCGNRDVLDVIGINGPVPLDASGPYADFPGVRAVREKRRVAVQNLDDPALPAALREQLGGVGVCSEIALPLGDEPWGLLLLFSDSVQGSDTEETGLLQRLAVDIAHAADYVAQSERLEFLAYHNPVTALPNRAEFRERLLPAMLREHASIAVAVLDVEGFGRVNDSRGREYGDQLLRQVGEALASIAPQAVVAHPESDDFVVAWPVGSQDPDAVATQLDAFLQRFGQQAFVIDDETVFVGLWSGLALAPAHGDDGEHLERNALAALADGKKRRQRVLAFTDAMRGRASKRLALERDLRHAIEAGEFLLHYQPKFHAGTQRLLGAEALLRWQRDDGLVSPSEFIPVLEETGLIVPVGRWVVHHALETALRWRALHHPSIRIAVNLSARELRSADFVEAYGAILGPHAADQPIDIEVTESLLMDDVDHSTHLLDSLREMGCRVAIDDFGTGYSSLNYLARLPADEIKIDRSFISLLAHSPETMGLVTNIITLAHSLSLQVVAEGVEEEEQAKLLRLLRCDALQGYLFGKPMSAQDFGARFFN
jgi:PAS domain S-box-containing protein/diguanylate cyclase (GGDEF)-like protein